MSAVRDFRDFVLRGNVVDLAVGIVIGAAFGTLVTGFVHDFINPLINIFGTGGNFAGWAPSIGNGTFLVGAFINTLISFLIIAAVVFFFVVRPVNALMKRAKHAPPADPTERECPYCLSTVNIKATRCPHCTSQLELVAALVAVPAAGIEG